MRPYDWKPPRRLKRPKPRNTRFVCLGISEGPTHRHRMQVTGRHPRYPHVHTFRCRNLQCTMVVFWDMKQGREVR